MLEIGELDQRITLSTPPAGTDAAGQPTGAPTLLAKLWAKKRDLTGREFLAAQATQNTVDAKFEIYYRPGIVAPLILEHKGVAYNVLAVLDPDGRKESLHLLCSARV